MRSQKKRNAAILAMALAFALAISGCGQQAGGDSGNMSQTQGSEVAGSQAGQIGETSSSTAEGSGEQELPEAVQLSANLSSVFTDFIATKENFSGTILDVKGNALGGMLPIGEKKEPEVYSKEKIAEVNRAMRAYTKEVDDLIVNNAKEYYIYGLLTKEQQTMYDAYYTVAQDPTSYDNYVAFQTSQDIQSEDFVDDLYMSLIAMCYDHPELWWMYPWNGTVEVGWGVGDTVNGKTTMYTGYMKTYDNFERDVKAFNKAVEEFLSDIDLSASDEEKALQIHDKLIEMATYDYAILQEGKNDFGHTAFGPFVTNTEGTPHYCVCDGYSQAYLYALQQVGITGAVVVGMAGNAGVDGGMGLHAWNLVKLDGIWYEVDSTWDDHTDYAEQVEQYYTKGSNEYKYCKEAASDKVYMNFVSHFMYRITTAEIQDFEPGPSLYYTSRDGKARFSIVGPSQRWRVCDDKDMGTNFEGDYTRILPIADGKQSGDSGQGGSSSQTQTTQEDDEDDYWDGGNGDISELISSGSYKEIAGTYYVSAFNNYTESVLKQYYGNEYYKQLSMFELKANGDGVLYENGQTMDFHFIFDGAYLYMYSDNGGMIFLAYNKGNFIMYDYYGNIYTFSKLK